MTTIRAFAVLLATLLFAFACGSDEERKPGVSNTESARRAYLGLDSAIEKALNLGMQGFNAATSANIAPQTTSGDVGGTLVVGGQVDQGASANKTMRLATDFTTYEDAVAVNGDAQVLHIVYDAISGGTTTLEIKLAGIPDGTFTGTFQQTLHMSGDLEGDVILDLAFSGDIQAGTGGGIERVPGTTHVTGTATSPYGTYTVDLTI